MIHVRHLDIVNDTANARVFKYALDEPLHAIDTPAQHVHLLARFIGELVGEVFLDPPGKIGDGTQRRLEVVRRDIGKVVEFSVGALELDKQKQEQTHKQQTHKKIAGNTQITDDVPLLVA